MHNNLKQLGNYVSHCYGITVFQSSYALVLQYYPQGSLRKFIPDLYKTNWYSRLGMLKDIAKCLQKIHENNLVHKDLHSENIFVDRGFLVEQLCIGDFGLIKPAKETVTTGVNSSYGIIPYM